MLKSRFELKKAKEQIYQVLFLTNDSSQDVTVYEAKDIDFGVVEQHLELGGAIFITGNNSQKIILPEKNQKEKERKIHTPRVALTYFDHI